MTDSSFNSIKLPAHVNWRPNDQTVVCTKCMTSMPNIIYSWQLKNFAADHAHPTTVPIKDNKPKPWPTYENT